MIKMMVAGWLAEGCLAEGLARLVMGSGVAVSAIVELGSEVVLGGWDLRHLAVAMVWSSADSKMVATSWTGVGWEMAVKGWPVEVWSMEGLGLVVVGVRGVAGWGVEGLKRVVLG